MNARSLALLESRAMIAAASLLVPHANRAEWRAEWNAEMWHAWRLLEDRGEPNARAQLIEWTRGAFSDAAWYRLNELDRDRLFTTWRRRSRSPGFCLGVLASLLLAIALASGLLPSTRAVLVPLDYSDAGRVATVSEGAVSLGMRSGPMLRWTHLWQTESRTIQGIATYVWRPSETGLDAEVSPRFFSLLGVPAPQMCATCALLSYDTAVARYGRPVDSIGRSITVNGRPRRIAGVLPKGFWFLSRRISVWTPAPATTASQPWYRTGVVVRMASDATPRLVEQELISIVRKRELLPWNITINVAPVQGRVRSVLLSFALGLALAVMIVLAGARLRLPRFNSFFVLKCALAVLAVLLAVLEFTPAPSITMTGGTDLATEPVSTWLFLVGCMGALSWSIHDQRRRCRVCVRRLGLGTQVGCSGCLLLNWAGTELVCMEGHGILHVPEMEASWSEPEHWTVLDESWQELFAPKAP